jgi:hypothetical protein
MPARGVLGPVTYRRTDEAGPPSVCTAPTN